MQLNLFLWWVNPKEFDEKQINVVMNCGSILFTEEKECKLRGRCSQEQNISQHHQKRNLSSFFKYIHSFSPIALLFLHGWVQTLKLIEALTEVVMKCNSDNISDWQNRKTHGSMVNIGWPSAFLCGSSQGPLQVMHVDIILSVKQAQRPSGSSRV